MGCMSKHETRRGGYAPWCSQYGDMWRTSNDINADWDNVLSNLGTLAGRGGDAGPYVGWNDPGGHITYVNVYTMPRRR